MKQSADLQRKILLIPFFICLVMNIYGQVTFKDSSYSGHNFTYNFHAGRFINNNQGNEEFPELNMASFHELGIGWQADGTKLWHHLYNFPETGISCFYGGFGAENFFGKMYGVLPYMTINVSKTQKRLLRVKLGLGFSYFTKPHDYENNQGNRIIGSHITNFSTATFSYQRTFTDNIFGLFGLSYFHNSNGHYQLPNLGSNTVVVNAGIKYFPRTYPEKKIIPEKIPDPYHGIKTHVRFGYGIHEFGIATDIYADKKYPVYTFTTTLAKKFGKMTRTHAGFSVKYYTDWKEKIRESNYYTENIHLKSSAITFILGNEFFIDQFSLYIHGGLNIYNPYYKGFVKELGGEMDFGNTMKKLFNGKFGLQYYLKDTYFNEGFNCYAGIYIKSNLAAADFVEIALGITL